MNGLCGGDEIGDAVPEIVLNLAGGFNIAQLRVSNSDLFLLLTFFQLRRRIPGVGASSLRSDEILSLTSGRKRVARNGMSAAP